MLNCCSYSCFASAPHSVIGYLQIVYRQVGRKVRGTSICRSQVATTSLIQAILRFFAEKLFQLPQPLQDMFNTNPEPIADFLNLLSTASNDREQDMSSDVRARQIEGMTLDMILSFKAAKARR